MSTRVGTPIGKSRQEFKFGPWAILAEKGHILKSDEAEKLAKELELPQLPEMTFGDNKIRISHSNGFSVEFNSKDALKKVDNKNDLVKVAVSREWLESRKDCEYITKTVRPFDWTYTTDYRGTVHGSPENVTVEVTDEKIDIEKLKVHEKIAFFEQVVLFEDELADHGCAELTVKMRVMPSCFFLLMRFFLRVDGLMAKIHDTRLYHECGKDYMLREYCEKQCDFSETRQLPPSALTDPHKLDKYLTKVKETVDKLSFRTETQGKKPSQSTNETPVTTFGPTGASVQHHSSPQTTRIETRSDGT